MRVVPLTKDSWALITPTVQAMRIPNERRTILVRIAERQQQVVLDDKIYVEIAPGVRARNGFFGAIEVEE